MRLNVGSCSNFLTRTPVRTLATSLGHTKTAEGRVVVLLKVNVLATAQPPARAKMSRSFQKGGPLGRYRALRPASPPSRHATCPFGVRDSSAGVPIGPPTMAVKRASHEADSNRVFGRRQNRQKTVSPRQAQAGRHHLPSKMNRSARSQRYPNNVRPPFASTQPGHVGHTRSAWPLGKLSKESVPNRDLSTSRANNGMKDSAGFDSGAR